MPTKTAKEATRRQAKGLKNRSATSRLKSDTETTGVSTQWIGFDPMKSDGFLWRSDTARLMIPVTATNTSMCRSFFNMNYCNVPVTTTAKDEQPGSMRNPSNKSKWGDLKPLDTTIDYSGHCDRCRHMPMIWTWIKPGSMRDSGNNNKNPWAWWPHGHDRKHRSARRTQQLRVL